MSRLTIDISDLQHQNLKALAALQGKTIRQYALERLFSQQSDEDVAWQELKALLTKRIDEGLTGRVSDKNMAAIFNEELNADCRA